MIAVSRERETLSGAAVVGIAAWVASVFFYKDHFFTVSRYDEWAPWASHGTIASGGNVLKGAALGTIGLVGAWLLLARKEASGRVHATLLAAMFAYVGWCAASVLWTADRGASVRQLVVLFAIVVGAWGIASRTRPRDLAKMLLIICGSYLAIGLFAEFSLGTFRPWAGGYRFAGTVHPNAQGSLCAILGISSLAMLLGKRDERRLATAPARVGFGSDPHPHDFARSTTWRDWIPVVLLSAAMVGLILAKSRTCVGGFVLASAILLAFRVSGRTKATAGFSLAWMAVAALFLLAVSGVDLAAEAESAMYMGRQEESEALSGRLPIWTELSNYVAERPWTGYGYAAFWSEDRIDTISRDVMWTFREAHSTIFEILLSVGGVGLSLYLGSVSLGAGIALRRAIRGDGYAAYLLALLAFAGITALTESSVVWPCLETTVLGVALFQLALRRGDETLPVVEPSYASAATPASYAIAEGATAR